MAVFPYLLKASVLFGVVSLVSRLGVAQPGGVAVPELAVGNAPPSVPKLLPEQYEQGNIVAVLGRTLRFTVVSVDPEGQAVRLMATGLPEGASFSDTDGVFTFVPTAAQTGNHVVRFVATDGQLQSQRSITVLVTKNRHPSIANLSESVNVNAVRTITLSGSDPDGDTLVYSCKNLPHWASLDADQGVITLSPGDGDVGRHVIHTTVSDGSSAADSELVVYVEADDESLKEDDWESFFMPGVGYSVYSPRAHEDWGTLHGATIELLMGSWIHHNNNRGPSHGRIYLQVELLDSTKADVPIVFTYAAGFSLSLERNPKRRWLLPMFGVDTGGMSQDDMGSLFQVVPFAGLHAYSSQNLFVNLRGGYRLVPAEMERFGGWHAALTVNASVW
jgi:hypothetical protein